MKKIICILLLAGILACCCSCSLNEHTTHEYGETVVVKAATCTTRGEQYSKCTVCDYEYKQVIQPHHTWVEATCTTARTCSLCGEIDGRPLNHNYGADGLCKTCSNKIAFDVKIQSTLNSSLKISTLSTSGQAISTCVVNKITREYKVLGNDNITLRITISGKKTFDAAADTNNAPCKLAYKLYDDNGDVVKSGIVTTHILAKGDAFSGVSFTIEGLMEKPYRLEFVDYIPQ